MENQIQELIKVYRDRISEIRSISIGSCKVSQYAELHSEVQTLLHVITDLESVDQEQQKGQSEVVTILDLASPSHKYNKTLFEKGCYLNGKLLTGSDWVNLAWSEMVNSGWRVQVRSFATSDVLILTITELL